MTYAGATRKQDKLRPTLVVQLVQRLREQHPDITPVMD